MLQKGLVIFLVLATRWVVHAETVSLSSEPFWDVQHPLYNTYQQQAATHINMAQNECAKFVNRLFKYRFGKFIWGNAWDMQLQSPNQTYLHLVWQIDPQSYDRSNNFELKNYQDRVEHFQALYETIESDYHPIGVVGFLYRYSSAKDFLTTEVLPQTHVAFLAGRQTFTLTNVSPQTQTLQAVLEKQYGQIHDYEIPLTEARLGYSLYHILLPGQSIEYDDYLLEQQFQGRIESLSLLSVFLRKHRNNHKTSILRPVSFSRITYEVFR